MTRNILLLCGVTIAGVAPRCEASEPVDFRTQVVPVLTKLGCNSGACHGSAAGRGEFHLSLYGSRPEDDFDAIVREFRGRRINLVHPEQSLVVLKPGGELDHEGGYLFDVDDSDGRVLTQWLAEGAHFNTHKTRRLKRLETDVLPLVFETPDVKHSLTFTAIFDDGSRRDVTPWTVVNTPDESAIAVDEFNRITVKRRGRHVLTARFLKEMIPLEVIVPFEQSSFDEVKAEPASIVDNHINRRLRQLNLTARPLVADPVFLRRVTLDLTGRLPDPKHVEQFLKDQTADKRMREIQRLLSTEAFTDYWTFQLAELLQIRTQPQDRVGAKAYHQWLRQQVRDDVGWDQMVRSLLISSGDTHLVGEANFYRTSMDAREQTEFASEALMGVTLRCANCHDHPLDRWTQDDYHGLAAVFAKIRSGRMIELNPRGTNTHPLTGQPAAARLPGGFVVQKPDGREAFADWLVQADNQYFAAAMVNRLWKAAMGRGLVDPVDDLRISNPATHPRLLKALAEDFVQNGYRLRHTLKLICSSQAYQRSRAPEPTGSELQFYSARTVTQLSPAVLADAVCDVTGVPEEYEGMPMGTRAVQLWDPKTPSEVLDVLGRCSRENSCEAEGSSSGGLAAQLHFMNGDFLNTRLFAWGGRLSECLKQDWSDEQIVSDFYLRAYSRFPSEEEQTFWLDRLTDKKSAVERRKQLEDFVWSLLSSSEFVTNH